MGDEQLGRFVNRSRCDRSSGVVCIGVVALVFVEKTVVEGV
jgi:hypothetical protein